MDQIKLVNTGNGSTAIADVLQRSDRRMKVAIVNTTLTVTLSKATPDEKNYTGRLSGLEFSSTGEII